MAQTVNILLNATDRDRLEQIVGDRNRPLKHVLRARIVLLSGVRWSPSGGQFDKLGST